MCGPLLLFGLIFPVLEIWLLTHLGAQFGALNVCALTVVTAAIGMILVRGQGLSLLRRLAQGEVPNNGALIEGPLLVVAAVCLFLPGFISDGIGGCLLLPPVRRYTARRIAYRFGKNSQGIQARENPENVVIVVRPKERD